MTHKFEGIVAAIMGAVAVSTTGWVKGGSRGRNHHLGTDHHQIHHPRRERKDVAMKKPPVPLLYTPAVKKWELLACMMLEAPNPSELRDSYPSTYNRLAEAAHLVEKTGGELKSRQAIAVIIVGSGSAPVA